MKNIEKENLKNLEQRDFTDNEYINDKKYNYAIYIWLFFIKFSELEHEINISIANLINEWSHDIGYSIIEWLDFEDKLEIYIKLSKKYISVSGKNIWLISKLKKLKTDIKKSWEFRNILAHSNWYDTIKWWYVRNKFLTNKNDWLVEIKYIKILPRNIKAEITKIDKILEKIYTLNENITWL